MLVNCSIDDAVSCNAAACSSVRCDRSVLPLAACHLMHARRDRVGAAVHGVHDPGEAALHFLHRVEQLADLVRRLVTDLHGEVAPRHVLEDAHRFLERQHDGVFERVVNEQNQRARQHEQADRDAHQ
ncbi:hypothetical protein CBA19CS91_08020 [Paraburkholderia hospita]|nr:hypothetical protein CBA19CS91_08020 [Paraburkholderia hospita]